MNPKLLAVGKEEQRSLFVKVSQAKSKDSAIQVCKWNIHIQVAVHLASFVIEHWFNITSNIVDSVFLPF